METIKAITIRETEVKLIKRDGVYHVIVLNEGSQHDDSSEFQSLNFANLVFDIKVQQLSSLHANKRGA